MNTVRQFSSVIAFLLVLWFLAGAIAGPVSAQENRCDANLVAPPGDPLGYQQREDRCEGRFVRNVASPVLLMFSLTESFEKYDSGSKQPLKLEWRFPQSQRITLRAYGVQTASPRLFYRMDTTRAPETASFVWPPEVLQALNITSADLGVVAWITQPMNGVEREIYLPLRVGQQHAPGASDRYEVVLWPGQELTEVYVSLATVDSQGSPVEFLWDGKALAYGYYPSERGIAFDILKTELQRPGAYYLEIGATLRSGGVFTLEQRFYHAG
ncbi:MAG: hypothetical protein RBT80_02155 [Candidatus Vecturithrix sp.]|jgi:hypothetical protein|nr:hypothetical protein [Candidatus Vecturithrix sp.]